MDTIQKSMVDKINATWLFNTTVAYPELNPTDPWLFTDPLAIEIYRQDNRLEALEEDILTYVMYDGQWASEEMECQYEIRRLLEDGLLAAKGCFGDLSPHSTLYSARGRGELKIAGKKFHFKTGDELIFEPWLERLTQPGLSGPVRVGYVRQFTRKLRLCCDAFPEVYIHCDNTRVIMREILSYRNKES